MQRGGSERSLQHLLDHLGDLRREILLPPLEAAMEAGELHRLPSEGSRERPTREDMTRSDWLWFLGLATAVATAVLVIGVATSPFYGAAAITAFLASFGPGGMIGGAASVSAVGAGGGVGLFEGGRHGRLALVNKRLCRAVSGVESHLEKVARRGDVEAMVAVWTTPVWRLALRHGR